MKKISFKIEHAKSMGDVEKVMKLVATTDEILTSLPTTLQVWTPQATISLYFICKRPIPLKGEGQTYTLIATEV